MKNKRNLDSIVLAYIAFILIMTGIAGASVPAGGPYAYIPNSNDNTVSAIDTATNTVTATLSGFSHPTGVAVSPDGTKAYVTNEFGTTVSVIDTATNTVTTTVTGLSGPTGVVFSPDGTKAYVANSNSLSVSIIDTSDGTITGSIPLTGTGLCGIAITPDGTKVYVAHKNVNKVSVIDTTSNSLTATISVGWTPMGIAVNPDGTKAYVANSGSGNISIIDIVSNTAPESDSIEVGNGPYTVAFNPTGTKAYVTNSLSNTVSVINTETKVVTTVNVGAFPWGVAVNSDGTKAYVTNYNDNTVSVIDPATDTDIGQPIDVGNGPEGFGQFTLFSTPNPSYTIDKTVTDVANRGVTAHGMNSGDVIKYRIIVKNTGNVDLTNVAVTDPLISSMPAPTGNNAPAGPLKAGDTWTYTPTYTITQADLNNKGGSDGDIDNTATVDCTQLDPKTDSEAVTLDYNPDYSIEKTVTDVAGKGATAHGTNAGEVIKYKIEVKNIGNIDLTNVNISDSLNTSLPAPSGDNAPLGTLNAGETWTYTPTYTITQADLNNKGGGDGFINNTVTVDCTELNAKTDSAAVPIDYNPAYSINKTLLDIAGGIAGNVTKQGDVVSYNINLTNDGNIDLTNVSVTDPLINLGEPVESKITDRILNPEENWTYNVNYTVIQEDINDNGKGDEFINNTVSVDCTELDLESASAAAHIDQTPYLINKTITDVGGKGPTANVTKAGDVITYQVNVTNYGGLPFKPVSIYDSLSVLTGPSETKVTNKVLDPGENWFYAGNYTVTQADLDSNGNGTGFLNNTVIAYFYGGVKKSETQLVGSYSAGAEIPVEQNPSYTINKTVTNITGGVAGNVTKAGDIITYQINLTNDGNIDLTNVTVNDTLVSLTNPVESSITDGILAPEEYWTYTGNYTVTQADISSNGGGDEFINNTATVDCDQLDPEPADAAAHIDQTPYLVNKTIKDVAGKGPLANATREGDIITYQVNVTNYGGLPFKPVSIYDSLIPLTGPMESKVKNKILDAGEIWTYTGNYEVKQADLNDNGGGDGVINNTVIASFYGGVKPENKFVGSESASVKVTVEQNPSYVINKTILDVAGNGALANATKAGDVITYQINVTNDGNIDLENVVVNDSLIKLKGPLESKTEDGIFNPEESWIYNVSYTVTQEDLNTKGGEDGFINNTATVDCDLLDPKNDSAAVPLEWNPVYSINKTVVDIDGNGPVGNATKAGEVITYWINVTNDGNIDLTNVNVSDLLVSLEEPIGDGEPFGTLNVGEDWNYTATYTVTQEDLNSNGDGDGFINNTVSIVCDQLEQKSSSAEVQVEQKPAYNVSKTITDVAGNGSDANVTKVGDIITYEINVTNAGNIDLTNVNVSDSLVTLEDPAGNKKSPGIMNVGTNVGEKILHVGEDWIYTATYTVTSADLNSNGQGDKFINNTVIIDCDQLDPENDSAVVSIEQDPAYTIKKTILDVAGKGPEANITNAGDIISYQVNVTNDGNIGLNKVTVADSLIKLSEPNESITADKLLELGETWTYVGNYTATQADLNSNGGGDGVINNTATVDCDELDQENDSAGVPVEQNPAYSINKKVTDVAGRGPEANVTAAGDVISYQINLTNEGNVDLSIMNYTNFTMNDSLFKLTRPIQSKTVDYVLEVGETWTFNGNYTVTQADLNSNGEGDGFINNTAAINSDELGMKNVSAEVPVEQKPAYSINKTVINVANRGPEANVTSAGDVIYYYVNVTNEGNIDLNNVSVNDSLINLTGPYEFKSNLVTQSPEILQKNNENRNGILDVGESWIYIGTYNVTQADMNSNGGGDGFINNTVTADCDGLDQINDSAEVPVEQKFDCSVYKSVIGADNAGDGIVDKTGDVIEYRIAVKNEGNVDLTNISVNDPSIKLTKLYGDDTDPNVLNVGETWKFYGNYTVTQDDINCYCGGDGYIDNTATVSCDGVPNRTSTVRQPVLQSKSLLISKSLLGVDNAGDSIINKAGDIIEYQISVKNKGKVDLTNVSVSDPMVQLTAPVGDEGHPGVLDAGETWKYTGNYTVTQEDISSNGGGDGYINNTATVHCKKLSDKASSVSVPIIVPRTFGIVDTYSGSNTTNETDSEASGIDNGTADDGSSSSGSSSSSSHSSGSSSGGAGGSPEPQSNVEIKEISQTFVNSGKSVKFDFPRNATPIVYVSFDSKKTTGKTTTIIEMLKGKSTLVSGLPSGEVYKSLNIWVGNSGFATPSNIENAVVCFKVEKSWIQDKKIDKSSITLNRYSDKKWEQLLTSLLKEDDKYLYFTAKTPGFSPFAITGKTTTGTEIQSATSTQTLEQENENTAENVEQIPEQKNNTSTPEKESKSTPGFEIVCGMTGLLAVFMYRKR
jgi:PGF-pre-PGF domain-containing protein/uncharacterized repeat protein (TIGR01451 family)